MFENSVACDAIVAASPEETVWLDQESVGK